MTKTLYDPEVEKRGIEKGIERGIEKGIKKGIEKGIEIKAKKSAENLLKLGVSEEIVAQGVGLTIEEVREIKRLLIN